MCSSDPDSFNVREQIRKQARPSPLSRPREATGGETLAATFPHLPTSPSSSPAALGHSRTKSGCRRRQGRPPRPLARRIGAGRLLRAGAWCGRAPRHGSFSDASGAAAVRRIGVGVCALEGRRLRLRSLGGKLARGGGTRVACLRQGGGGARSEEGVEDPVAAADPVGCGGCPGSDASFSVANKADGPVLTVSLRSPGVDRQRGGCGLGPRIKVVDPAGLRASCRRSATCGPP